MIFIAQAFFNKESNPSTQNIRVIYAGYIEAPTWDVNLREGKHEHLISFETFNKIQMRLNGYVKVPARKNWNEDFPLRGFVVCGCCNTPLTANWLQGRNSRYAYYLCRKKGCDHYGKLIQRDQLEGEFEELLHRIQPTKNLYAVAKKMLEDLWSHSSESKKTRSKLLESEIRKIDNIIEQLLYRIVEADSDTVIRAYEKRVKDLEGRKLEMKEKIAYCLKPIRDFDETFRTAMGFLSKPYKLWVSDRMEHKRAVLKLTFTDRLLYDRGAGVRTAETILPFKVLGGGRG